MTRLILPVVYATAAIVTGLLLIPAIAHILAIAATMTNIGGTP